MPEILWLNFLFYLVYLLSGIIFFFIVIIDGVFCLIHHQDDTQDVIAEMRQDIARLRDKIASASQPDRDDIGRMEVSNFIFYI